MTRLECRQRIWAIIAAHLEEDTHLSEDIAGVFHEYSDKSQDALCDVIAAVTKRAGATGPGPWGTKHDGHSDGDWKPSGLDAEDFE